MAQEIMGATMEESAVCRFIGKRYTSADGRVILDYGFSVEA